MFRYDSQRERQRPITLALALVLTWFGFGPQEPCAAEPQPPGNGQWIWSPGDEPAPKNRLTYFRKEVDLAALPDDATLHLAADSNARVWINGQIVRRKVARYHEPLITAEVVNAAPYLHTGKNVVVVLHHNWGNIVTFQRTGNKHAGLYVRSSWLNTDASWRCLRAPEFAEHDKQIVGVIGDPRIRYPQILDGRKTLADDIHKPGFDDSAWPNAVAVNDGPLPATPTDVETPGQREFAVRPLSILAAGKLKSQQPISAEPLSIAAGIRIASCEPDEAATREAGRLLAGQPVVIEGRAGESRYVTFDFGKPVHGYPFLALQDAPAGTSIDFGYCEVSRALYTGDMHVREDGWLNPEGVVGKGYADRYITRTGPQSIEMPDERTARWFALHIHFPADGRVVVTDAGMTRSQYPITPVGTFACGDERIDQIVKLCLIHAEVTMIDTYVDTPGREDGQWIEDARPRAQLASRWFGDTNLLRFMIRTLAQGQFEDGNLHPFAPSNYPVGGASFDWSVQWVAMLHDAYLWTGDPNIVKAYWPQLCKYWRLVLSKVDDKGLWLTNHVLADIRVGVHPANPKQSSGMVTPWIIERLRWSAEMAEAAGEKDQARAWQATADKMADAFRKYHIVPAAGNVPAHVGDRLDPADAKVERGYSQAGQTVAIITGLLTRDEARADLDYAYPAPVGSPPAGVTRWNNPTYGYRSLRALSEAGYTERAVAHLIERYSPYLPANPRNPVPLRLQGPFGGPLPEYWVSREDLGLKAGDKDTAQPADETGSHGWGSVPLLWLHDSLLGVRVTEPGGGRIRIAPDAGGLPYVAGYTATPKGLVRVFWDPQQWRMEVSIPKGVKADLVAPAACAGKRLKALATPGGMPAIRHGSCVLEQEGEYVFAAQ